MLSILRSSRRDLLSERPSNQSTHSQKVTCPKQNSHAIETLVP